MLKLSCLYTVMTSLLLGGFGWALVSCSDDDSDAPLNFYSSVRLTAAGFIEADDAQFSEFKTILERSNYLSMLKTYGHYTVFAPTNEAIKQFLQENGLSSLDALTAEQCDTIARTHIVQDKAYFTTDMGGELAPVNMNDDYILMDSKSDADNDNALLIYVNTNSRIIQKDDSVTNGVVHVIDHVIKASNEFLSTFMEDNPNLTIFSEALRITGMADSLAKYDDLSYTVNPDSAWGGKGFKVPYGTANDGTASKQCNTWYPQKRLFKFTAFVETDSVYRAHNINNLDDLKAYAKQVYDESYPEDAGKYDDDFTDRRNPLNRFVSYHLINRMGPRDYWVHCKGDIYTQKFLFNIYDPEDYYETMAPHTLIRFCSNPGEEIYINRVGLKNKAEVRGVRVLKNDEGDGYNQSCKNGRYIYIDDILVYSREVRWNVLNRRIRIDGSCLSPDFMNGHARMEHMGKEEMMIGFKNGFLADFKMHNASTFIGCGNEQTGWRHYQGSGVCITGEKFDASVKLPPVPHDGTYEVRLGYSLGDDRGIAQVYLNNDPCGIPISFRNFDSNIGWEADTDDEEENQAIDKAMRNRGFMKAMDSYGSTSEPFRTYNNDVRRILTKQYLRADQDYWLRFRQILEGSTLYMSIDYIELCPKDVYDSPEGEDRH
ncbi:MAG: fasciclin domain-containing protein [Prevotella sp.]|nr:fasciclin domain-containing protein [Prevotella sp.]